MVVPLHETFLLNYVTDMLHGDTVATEQGIFDYVATVERFFDVVQFHHLTEIPAVVP